MPTYSYTTKDGKKLWYCSFYIDTPQGRIKKKKSCFAREKDAKAWEREFLVSYQYSADMPFRALYELYSADVYKRIKKSSKHNKERLIKNHILPFFDDLPLSKITPALVRMWQNEKLEDGYSGNYLKDMHRQLTAIFNWACKFYGLKDNPAKLAGGFGPMDASKEMQIWAKEQFDYFIKHSEVSPDTSLLLSIAFWTGLRIGEILALTWEDVDLEVETIDVNKARYAIKGEVIISTPKTRSSKRVVPIHNDLVSQIDAYKAMQYDPRPQDQIFPLNINTYRKRYNKACAKIDVSPIRLHDFRHSHASLLIDMGLPLPAISKRLGHAKLETTLNVYAHMMPDGARNLADAIQRIAVE